ncbi:MAG TPA: septal ring lytic transglycosylase RlpA family protein [Stellaceae bacterium]|nr:septal ring lytic transglycosylase RlpA family protein [Stellaceae bacterium]
MSNRRVIAILVSGAFLAACHTFAPRAYGPGYTETGVASWYGSDFHHKRTANGERFDMNGLTAAHQTLPFDSYVRVTNIASGRSVVVRINDRGPFVGDRIIDLSAHAARQLGMKEDGVARVRIDVVNVHEVKLSRQRVDRGHPATLSVDTPLHDLH